MSGGKAEPRPSLFKDKYCHYTLHIQTSRALYTLQCTCIHLYILYTVGYFFTSLFSFASKLYILQRTVSRDFEHFYFLKTFINFTFHNADTVMAYSHRLHGVSRVVDYTWIGVCVVVDYTVYTLTQCLWSHRLRSNMTTWTPKVNFEGFSLTLKEQSGKRSILCVFTYSLAIFSKLEKGVT